MTRIRERAPHRIDPATVASFLDALRDLNETLERARLRAEPRVQERRAPAPRADPAERWVHTSDGRTLRVRDD